MNINFYKFKLTDDYNKIESVFLAHFFIIIIAIILEMTSGHLKFFGAIFKIVFFSAIYRYFYITLRELYYTFWTFSFFIIFYLVVGLFQSFFIYHSLALFYLYLTALTFLSLQAYVLSSPIYFPRVRWWEYDFRYRYDLKIKVRFAGDEYDGRLTDLRRGAGCVILFEHLSAGHFINIEVAGKFKNFNLKAEIVSKKEYTVGRGLTYGVKFHFDNPAMRKEFAHFSRYWKTDSLLRAKMKFKESESTN